MSQEFKQLDLHPELLENLDSLGYQQMTDIQAECLPLALAGEDLIAQAKTGSGKTAAFALALLQRLNVKRFRIQSLVLCPTRELADQVAKEIRRLARRIHNIKVLTLCGGMPIGPQIGSLEHGAHIVVGTPGRIQDHLRKGTMDLSNIHSLVLDEADRMLDMGFADAIAAILSECPKERQTQLYSATYPEGIEAISRQYQRSPKRVTVSRTHSESNISQQAYAVEGGELEKQELCNQLLAQHQPSSCVIFCATKKQTVEIAQSLNEQGWFSLALHGDMEQRERDLSLLRFANGSATVLVATDVAARGLDVDTVELVINYDLPRDAEVYVHRIGRTGRAGRSGAAASLVNDKQRRAFADIEAYLNKEIEWSEPPRIDDINSIDQRPKMVTIGLDAGKKNKLRPGDILGALTGEAGIEGKYVGKINVLQFHAYVAVARAVANKALKQLQEGKIKGRKIKVRKISRPNV
ncbi:ATP-dependent RNA helicase DbpA [uncultured Pseudoteredinibacter sp.]|uniref:ATP-dependent RNA helicase DbpA n=1 Tax=uncultured Pseudoteredinibacter sp. TaxID=1641701 RepID=UPI0026210E83|nr:ATP-dependent RNA helicase DbpA [uncultured Pseudoteredinibacter sp.]